MKVPSIFRLFMDDLDSSSNKCVSEDSVRKKTQKFSSGLETHKKPIRGISSEKAMNILKKEGEKQVESKRKDLAKTGGYINL